MLPDGDEVEKAYVKDFEQHNEVCMRSDDMLSIAPANQKTHCPVK